MNPLRFMQALLLCGLSGPVLAQAEDDPLARLKACSQKSGADRLECLEELSRRMNQAPGTGGVAMATAAARPDNWVISTTTSPVNYRPIVIASTPSRSSSDGGPFSLSISCRNGLTELAVTNNGDVKPGRGGSTVMVTHQVNDQPPAQQRWTASRDGRAATFAGDVVGLLQSLPDRGEISLRVSDRQSVLYDGKFLLDGVGIVREKVAAACKWPSVVAATPR